MDPQDFRVEPADFATDLADLRLVRETVFVQEQNVPIEEEWDDLDPQCRHVLARDLEDRPIGTGRLTPGHKIGRMAVLRDWRGRGVGDALLVALMDQARALGWTEVSLNAQVSAESFYGRHGFEPYGPRFEEAGIQHQAMRRTLEPMLGPERPGPKPRPPSHPAVEIEGLQQTVEASVALIADARRQLWIYTRDLEPSLYGHPAVLEALRAYATSGRGGVVQVIVQEPALLPTSGHPLIALAQRLTTVFQFRSPTEQVDQQYPSAFLGNDHDGFLFRLLGSRWDGEWSEAQPARTRQLRDHFGRVWERSRECTELRALGI